MENGREMRRVDMMKRETSKGSKFALSNGKLESMKVIFVRKEEMEVYSVRDREVYGLPARSTSPFLSPLLIPPRPFEVPPSFLLGLFRDRGSLK